MTRRIVVLVAVMFGIALAGWPALTGAGDKKAGPEVVATLKGHTDIVYAVGYSPDGKYVATASFDNSVKLWDATTGKEIKTYGGTLGHTKQAIAVGFSPDGAMLASGSTDNTLKVWDVPVNSPIRSFKTSDSLSAVALSVDGTKLALAGKDGSLKLVTPAEFKELVKFEAGHKGAITALAFNAAGTQLASVGVDRMLRYWNTATGQIVATVGAHIGSVNGLVINPGTAGAITVGDDGFLKIWSPTPVASKTLPGHASTIRALAMTTDNASYYTASDDRTVRQFGLAAAKETRSLTGPLANIVSVATHPNNTFIAAGTADSRVFLWNNTDGKVLTNWLAHAGAVTSVQVQPQVTQLMSAGGDGLVKFWAAPALAPRILTHADAVLAVATSVDGKKIVTGSTDKIVRIFDSTKQALEKQFAGHTGPVTAVALSANLLLLASGGADNTVRIWNQATAKESDVLLAHGAPVTALQFNVGNTQMLSASEDGAVKLWALPMVAPKSLVHPDAIAVLTLSPDGAKAITGGNDKTVRVWNLTSGLKEKDYLGPTLAITCVGVARSGATLAAGSADKTLTLWSAADGKSLHKLPMPALPQSVTFSADGQSVFVGLADGNIKQIKLADGKEIKTLPATHKGAVVSLALSVKGDLLYSASADKTIQTWALPDGTPKIKLDHVGAIVAMTLSKDGTKIAAVGDKVVKVWNAADAKDLGTIKLSADAKDIALSPDGTRVLVAGADKLARIYELDGTLLETLPHDGAVHGVAYVDAKRVVTGGADKLARLWTSSLVWQRKHQGPVRFATFSPKGDQIISAGEDKAIKLWNVADGKEAKAIVHDAAITHASLSADGTKLAVAGADKNVKVITLADGKTGPAVTLPVAVQSIALTPNGQRLAYAIADGATTAIRVHDLALGKDVQTLTDHAAIVKAMQFLTDGRTLVTASQDKSAKLLDVNILGALVAHSAGETFAQYHSTGTQVVSAGADKIVKLWDSAKGVVIKTFGPVADPVKAVGFSKDFTKVVVASGKSLKVWNLADGKEVITLTHPADVLSFSFSLDGTRIVTGSTDKQTRVWDPTTGKELQFFAQADPVDAVQHLANNVIISASGKVTHIDTATITKAIPVDTGATYALALAPANTHIFTGGADKIVKRWVLATFAKDGDFPGAGGAVKAIAISKNGLLLAVGGVDQTLRVYTTVDSKEVGSLKMSGEAKVLAFTPNNLALVGATAGKTLSAWSVPFTAGQPITKDFLEPVQGFTTPDLLSDITIAADNASIYSAGADKAMHVYRLASPAPTRNFPHPNLVDTVAFQPKGTLLASGGHDGKIRIFDLVKNVQQKEINAHFTIVQKNNVPQPIYSIVFSPDGKQLLSCSYDSSIKLWDVASGNLVKEFKAYELKTFEKGHQEPVYAATFSQDGKFIASGSSGLERAIKIWNLGDGSVVRDLANPNYKAAPMFTPAAHPGAVTALHFTKDGKHLISIGDAPANHGFVGIWEWQTGKMVTSHTLPLGVFQGFAVSPDETTIAVTAGNRDRKNANPVFNAAYVLKMGTLLK